MQKKIFRSAVDTKKFAAEFAKNFPGGVIALSGDLGAGKTTFTQGFAGGLGIKHRVISPTFVLERQHKIPGSKAVLFHIDLYRLDEKIDMKTLGFDDKIQNPENIIIIEWAEKAKESLPKNTTWIYFKSLLEESRELTF